MKNKFLLQSTALSLLTFSTFAAELVEWGSPESSARLSRSTATVDFFSLSNHFETQDNGVSCGLASTVTVLNALRLRKKDGLPVDMSTISVEEKIYFPPQTNPYLSKYTQNNVLNEKTKSKADLLGKPTKINGEMVNDFGLQLRQLAKVFEAHNTNVKLHVVQDDSKDDLVKKDLIDNLSRSGDYVVVNYTRKALGQNGGGHISPLGAYDEKSDSFLVLDVNPTKAPWVWIPSKDLIAAMRTFDTVENRGYLLISEK